MSNTTIFVTLCLLASAFTINAAAAEKRISRGQLPQAVRTTADGQSRGATIKDYTKDVENGGPLGAPP